MLKGTDKCRKEPVMSKYKRSYSIEFKTKIVAEYIEGKATCKEIADREGIATAQIYHWKSELEAYNKKQAIVALEEKGYSPEQARRIRELEEEIDEYKKKVAELSLHNDLLKKLHPNFQQLKNANGLIEIKKLLERSNGPAK